MQLSLYSDYAMRMLLYLAVRPKETVTIRQVSDAYGISKAHLMKIANELVHAGYIQAIRGRSGGLCLARPARQINVGEVLEKLEKRIPLVECFSEERNQCLLSPNCRLKSALFKAQQAFFDVLGTYTLEDLAKTPALKKLQP